MGNRSNLYLVTLAFSGAGKDHPRKVVKSLFLDCLLMDSIGENFASGEAIEDVLLLKPAYLWLADEFHAYLEAIKSGREPRYVGIANVLNKMFTSSGTQYSMRAKAGKPVTIIDQPGLSVAGASIPRTFYESLSPRMLDDGLFSRLLILEAGRRGVGQSPPERPIPNSIKHAAKWWSELSPGENRGNLSAFHPTPLVVPMTTGAKTILDELRAESDRHYRDAEGRLDAAGMAVWNRCHEKGRRLALNYAASADHLNLEVTEDAAVWASAFARHQSRKMLFMAGAHVVESPFDGLCKKVEDTLRRWSDRKGDGWMPGWELRRRIKEMSPREQKEALEALLGQGKIEREQSTGGRPGERFRLRGVPACLPTY
jgi:Protein of unknown function (DUF3987)